MRNRFCYLEVVGGAAADMAHDAAADTTSSMAYGAAVDMAHDAAADPPHIGTALDFAHTSDARYLYFWQLLALRVFALDPSTVHHDNSQILNKHRKLQVQVRLWRGTYHSHDQGFFAHSTAGLMCFWESPGVLFLMNLLNIVRELGVASVTKFWAPNSISYVRQKHS